MSQLISRLRREASTATTSNDRAELLSRLAGALARQGNFLDAAQCVADARTLIADSGAIGTVWIMLAEGLINLFEHQGPTAMDRIRRALLLGTALRQSKIVAYASAWKAHIEFENSLFDDMVSSLQTARMSAAKDDLDAQIRLSMVLQKAYAVCGLHAEAQRWFSHAHQNAVRNGDQTSIDGIQYNKVALELVRLRVRGCFERLELDSVQRLRRELQSSMNLTSLTRTLTLGNHMVLVEARCCLLERQYEVARDKLQLVRLQVPFAGNHFDQGFVELEICFCNFKLGEDEQVEIYLQGNHSVDFNALDRDDQIVGAWMQLQMASKDARFGDIDMLQSQLAELQRTYEIEISRLSSALQCLAVVE